MTQVFKNNATSRLVADIDQITTSIRVLPGEGERFPQPVGSDYFSVTIEDRRTGQVEICRCVGRSQDILNVVRGQEGTDVHAFAMGATVSNRLTAKTLNDYLVTAFTQVEADPLYVNVTGDVMTGPLQLKYTAGQDPVAATEAVNKDYVDRRFQAAIVTGMSISDTPPVAPYHGQLWWESDSGNMFIWFNDGNSAQWVQVNIDSSALSAPINSPAFTGDPTAPTPAAGDNDQSIATTAFVTGALNTLKGTVTPAMDTLGEIETAVNTNTALANTKYDKTGGTISGRVAVADATSGNSKPFAPIEGYISIHGIQLRLWADLSQSQDGDYDADMASKSNMYLVAGAGIHLIPGTAGRLPWNANGTIQPGGTPGRVVLRGNEVANYIQSGGSYNTTEAPEKAITGITKAANAVFTVPAHGFPAGVTVGIQSIPSSSMREMNGKYGVISIIDANSFTIGVDSSGYSTYTTGGVAINVGQNPWYKDLIITRYLSGAPWMIFDESEHGRCGIGRGFPKASETVPNAPVTPVDLYQVAARLHVLEDDIAYELPGNPYYERVALFETKNPTRAKIELKNATTSVTWTTGAGSPEGVVTATVGSLYSRTDGAANTTLYVKQTGTGNTGWAAK